MLAATPFATAVAGDMSYTYVEAGWTEVKIDDDWLDDPKGDGAYIRGSYVPLPTRSTCSVATPRCPRPTAWRRSA